MLCEGGGLHGVVHMERERAAHALSMELENLYFEIGPFGRRMQCKSRLHLAPATASIVTPRMPTPPPPLPPEDPGRTTEHVVDHTKRGVLISFDHTIHHFHGSIKLSRANTFDAVDTFDTIIERAPRSKRRLRARRTAGAQPPYLHTSMEHLSSDLLSLVLECLQGPEASKDLKLCRL